MRHENRKAHVIQASA